MGLGTLLTLAELLTLAKKIWFLAWLMQNKQTTTEMLFWAFSLIRELKIKIKTFVRKQQFELHTDTTSLSPDWLAWPAGGVGHTSCTSGTNSTSAAHHRRVLNLKRVRKKMIHLPTLKREPTELLSSLMCIHIEKRLSPEN